MITEKDLIGKLKGLPIQVVQRMIQHQIKQGNKANVEVFQNKLDAAKVDGGFDWVNTNIVGEGVKFWAKIINVREYAEFFNMYPIPQVVTEEVVVTPKKVEETYEVGELVWAPTNGRTFDNSTRKRVYIGKIEGTSSPYIVMTVESFNKLKDGKNGDIITCSEIKKITSVPQIVKLTLKDISEGKGIGIDPSLIKIVK